MIKEAAQKIKNILISHKNIIPFLLMPVSSVFSVVILSLLLLTTVETQKYETKYSIYTAKPHVLGSATNDIASDDAKAAMLDKVFEKYNCPLAGYGEKFVEEAHENEIPYWLVAAVAFQESSCGKNTPTKDGQESHNLWGWGVYGENVHMFNSWEHGIEVVSKYMKTRFYDQGITDLCSIMNVYTPQSNGSWCNGVQFFREEITNYKSPSY